MRGPAAIRPAREKTEDFASTKALFFVYSHENIFFRDYMALPLKAATHNRRLPCIFPWQE